MPSTPIEAAKARMRNAMTGLQEITSHDMMLEDLAKAVITADHLLSALSFLYDAMYEASRDRELIGRTPNHPITRNNKAATPQP